MKPGCTNLTEAVRSVHLLKINGYSAAAATIPSIKSKWIVDGYEWQIRFYRTSNRLQYHGRHRNATLWVALDLTLLREPRDSDVTASLSCRLVDPCGDGRRGPSEQRTNVFSCPGVESDPVLLMRDEDVPASGYLIDDSLTIECTITVLQKMPEVIIIADEKDEPQPMPSSNLHQHLGELLQSKKGADVTFHVAGEPFPAHKLILASRSPVFMAEFFGDMEETGSESVEIEDMEADVFKAMLHFVYTDTVPEVVDEEEPEAAAIMAQHLLAAADRYGLQRLKVICEGKLSGGIDVSTAATTLALAEQHSCSLLRAKCVEFITGSPETLDAVLGTKGYMHLAESCPLVLAELLKAARGKKN